jgi:dipeptidase D
MKTPEPSPVWNYFSEICKIPRPSKKEEKIIGYLTRFAQERGLQHRKDAAGNLLISKPAAKGMENKKPVVLQSHVDMVCEKNAGIDHDFENDPVIPMVKGEWVTANGTTLGADDGIGMAAQLAVLTSSELRHGDIECLFTVDEETGLSGAFALQPGFFQGRILINLDSEDEGELFIGCAGGIDTIATIEFEKEEIPSSHTGYTLQVGGLKGGHSGDDIHRGHGNSIKILNRLLWNINNRFDMKLAKFNGGNLRNAIPREAVAVFTVHRDDANQMEKLIKSFTKTIKAELACADPLLDINLKTTELPRYSIDENAALDLIYSLYACPHGVITWDHHLDNMVETSTNLASVKTGSNKITITTSQRSSSDSAKTDIASMVDSVFRLANANIKKSGGYPGWTPDHDSRILQISRSAYKKLFGNEPLVRSIHAGLECGLFLEKFPDLDMISFGPTIKGAHSPDERLHIGSVKKFWDLLAEILENVPEKQA